MIERSIDSAADRQGLRTTRRALFGVAIAAGALSATNAAAVAARRQSGVELRMAMRKLWEDHITYTRNFIISALGGLPDQPAVTARLLSNQDDIGNAIKPFYGDAAGAQLTRLLRSHILIAADIVTAAKAGDSARVTAKQQEWSANGRELAAFLSGANPHWPRAELAAMLQRHLDLTTGEVVSRIGSDWAADIRSYDAGHVHMLMFADVLTSGIMRQFPARFS
jgi:hypothetical protein